MSSKLCARDPREGGHGHTGLVTGPADPGWVYTVEGNVSNAVRGLARPVAGFTTLVRALAAHRK